MRSWPQTSLSLCPWLFFCGKEKTTYHSAGLCIRHIGTFVPHNPLPKYDQDHRQHHCIYACQWCTCLVRILNILGVLDLSNFTQHHVIWFPRISEFAIAPKSMPLSTALSALFPPTLLSTSEFSSFCVDVSYQISVGAKADLSIVYVNSMLASLNSRAYLQKQTVVLQTTSKITHAIRITPPRDENNIPLQVMVRPVMISFQVDVVHSQSFYQNQRQYRPVDNSSA